MKKTKTHKGITLIALIITIIVLLILAVVAISAVKESDIIVKAKDAVNQDTIGREIELIKLASNEYELDKRMSENPTFEVDGAKVEPLGDGFTITFEKTGNKYSVSSDGNVEPLENPTQPGGGTEPEQPGGGADSGNGEDPDESIIHADIIPEGGVYKRVAEDGTETQYTGGQAFPETVLDGDIYIYEDYEYRYNYVCFAKTETPVWLDIQTTNQGLASQGINLSSGGWGVRVIDANKTEYISMITTINGKDVTNLFCTYADCTNLVSTPKLSSKTKDMTYAFNHCTALTTVSNIPDSVTALTYTFESCGLLTLVSAIPSTVINMERTFACCLSLETAPDMSKAVNITNMNGTFEECELLTGEIEINANPTEYEHCFSKTKVTKITGTATNATKEALAKTGSNISWE